MEQNELSQIAHLDRDIFSTIVEASQILGQTDNEEECDRKLKELVDRKLRELSQKRAV